MSDVCESCWGSIDGEGHLVKDDEGEMILVCTKCWCRWEEEEE